MGNENDFLFTVIFPFLCECLLFSFVTDSLEWLYDKYQNWKERREREKLNRRQQEVLAQLAALNNEMEQCIIAMRFDSANLFF